MHSHTETSCIGHVEASGKFSSCLPFFLLGCVWGGGSAYFPKQVGSLPLKIFREVQNDGGIGEWRGLWGGTLGSGPPIF